MRSTSRLRRLWAAAAVAAVAVVAGCASGPAADDQGVPIIRTEGSRAFEYTSLDQLAERASAIVVITPTGEQFDVPLPAEHGGSEGTAPTPFVRVTVDRVLAGSVDARTIDLVSPGEDERTGERALTSGGPYIAFITPGMYAADDPIGGYVVVGGPAGLYAGVDGEFVRVDAESPKLPDSLSLEQTTWPQITRTEAELLHEGP